MLESKILIDKLKKLEKWIARNGMAGYDPYDLRGSKFYRGLLRIRGGKDVLGFGERFAPVLARKLFVIKPEINAKGVGLLALGYLTHFEATGDAQWQEKAITCLNWLESNTRAGYSGLCWGYPFDWYTRITLPKGTPSAVVSSIVGWAFLKAYRVLLNPHYLEIAKSISTFLVNDLNIDRLENDRVCFSYTPLDRFHVHNVNLFVAAHLAEVEALTGDQSNRHLVESAVAYTLDEQTAEGAWFYWGKPDNFEPHVDHYHTGFVLRCLDRLCRVYNNQQWLDALTRGFDYYVQHLFEPSGLPKYDPDNIYPVDIHGCAEALLCLSQLQPRFENSEALRYKTMRWIFDNMQADDGHFYYRKYPLDTVRIPYLRWGQAWMHWALAECFAVDHLKDGM